VPAAEPIGLLVVDMVGQNPQRLLGRVRESHPAQRVGNGLLAVRRVGCGPRLSRVHDDETGTAAAAVSIRFRTSSGCDTMATWFVEVSTVVAPIRFANNRCASGGIV
jgi:hypothetical protein